MKKFNLTSLLALFMFGMLFLGCGNDNNRPLPPQFLTNYCETDNECPANEFCTDNSCLAFYCKDNSWCKRGSKLCVDNNCQRKAIKPDGGPKEGKPDGGPDANPDQEPDTAPDSKPDSQPDDQNPDPTCTPQQEVCDGKDNDCDGNVDEDCDCKIGQTKPCGKAIGACTPGVQKCQNGKWSTCIGQIKPSKEICDGKDNDCDGTIDNDPKCVCSKGATKKCGSDVGECSRGTQTCQNGQWSKCQNANLPQKEICDGKDNDCNGQIDDRFPNLNQFCTVGKGECKNTGKYICDVNDRNRTVCSVTAKAPSTEVCNGKDDDCDGKVDNGLNLGAVCTDGIGECKNTGKKICNFATKKVICSVSAKAPSTEVCNGKDDDCDGGIDEDNVCNSGGCNPGTTQKCGSKVGTCSQGTQFCKADGSWSTCSGEIKASTEICDGKDNDCDGQTDESLTRACGSSVGECTKGVQTCSAGKWGTCSGTASKAETCNGKDDDCDGKTDEDFTNLGQSCSAGAGSCARTGRFVCKSDGSSVVCDAQPAPPGTETCNGKDDDCDGLVDEGLSKCLEVSLVQTKNQTVKVGDQSRTDVKLTYNFHMSTSLVTQDQFKTIMGYLPTQTKSCGNCPVVNITAHEAMALANKLSKAANVSECYTCSGSGSSITCSRKGTLSNYYTCTGYRLPSEVEWELAARCGQKTYQQYICTPLSSCAHFGNMNGSIQPVRQKAKSSCGLYDMLGNTYVITDEGWDRSKVFRGTNPRSNDQQNNTIRGCSYQSSTANCSTGKRHVWLSKTGKRRDTSVRFVRTIP